jgi:hypothetical protein
VRRTASNGARRRTSRSDRHCDEHACDGANGRRAGSERRGRRRAALCAGGAILDAPTYEAQYRRRLRLSTGSLRRALKRAPPTREQIAGYRTDQARLDAAALAVTSLLQTSSQARYRIVLDERSIAAGQAVEQRASYLVDLQRHGGRWLVAAFTVQP